MPLRRSRLSLLPALVALALGPLSGACGGPETVEGGLELLLGATENLMGPTEQEALDLLNDMALVVASNAERPEQAVSRLEAFLDVNGARMLQLTDAIEGRYREFEPRVARVYEAQLGEWMAPAHDAWRGALRALTQQSREEAHQVELLVHEFDRSDRARQLRARASAPPR